MNPTWEDGRNSKKYVLDGKVLGEIHREWGSGRTFYVATTPAGRREFGSWSRAKRFIENTRGMDK